MKHVTFLTTTLLIAISLTACAGKKQADSSQTKEQMTTTQVAKSSTDQSTAADTDSNTDSVVEGMDIGAIFRGDYSSIKGTWKNGKGQTLVFDENGLVGKSQTLSSDMQLADGLLKTSVSSEKAGGFILFMVPKGIAISQSYFIEGNDTSDKTRDRLLGTQQALSSSDYSPYYWVSADTTDLSSQTNTQTAKLELDFSDQGCMDYLSSLLGRQINWKIIEDNSNRTESDPFKVLQGDDGSLYRVYKSGIVLDAAGTIIYEP